MSTLTCPKCQHDNTIGMRFCQRCGHAISVSCLRCNTANPILSSFCGICGVKISEATYGIPFDELGNWIEVFSSLGWLEEAGPKTIGLINTLKPPFEKEKRGCCYNHIHGLE